MSGQLDDNIRRWTAKRKSALVIEIIQGKATVAEASRSYDLAPSEIENWVDDARKGMENALRTNPLDVAVLSGGRVRIAVLRTPTGCHGVRSSSDRFPARPTCPRRPSTFRFRPAAPARRRRDETCRDG